jgi:CheY-like chemotaxis protein
MRGWHFVGPDLTLRFSGEPLELGNVYAAQGSIRLCDNGMHASGHLLDALKYANSTHACYVEIRGDLRVADDKFCGRYRWVLGHGELDLVLHRLALKAADMAISAADLRSDALTDALEAKRGWIERRVSENRLAEAAARAMRVVDQLGSPAAHAVVHATQIREIGKAALRCVDAACGTIATVVHEPAVARTKRAALNEWLESEAGKILRYWHRKQPKNFTECDAPRVATARAACSSARTPPARPAIDAYLLLVEHNREEVLPLASELRAHTFREVQVAHDVVGAIRRVIQDPVDMILCDTAIPGMSVDMFRKAIGRVRPDLCDRLVFMTDGLGDSSVWSAIGMSGAPLLWRPFTLPQFLNATRRITNELR